MTFIDALSIARRTMSESGLIHIERNKMVASEGGEEAKEVAAAYNRLADLQRLLDATV